MRILFSEPTAPRYIHINPESNYIHLMVPIVSGQEIGTDNTCKSTVALDNFFKKDGGALDELNAYKDALIWDIQLLEKRDTQRVAKESRLAQIEAYIEAVPTMWDTRGMRSWMILCYWTARPPVRLLNLLSIKVLFVRILRKCSPQ